MTTIKRLPDRAVVAVAGADAGSLLQGLITNGPPAEGGAFSALLTPQGKVLFDFFIAKTDDGYLLDVAADAADALVKRLMLYRLRAKVDITKDDRHVVCACAGTPGSEVDAVVESAADQVRSRMFAKADALEDAALDTDYHARRIRAGVPEWGADFESNEVFPMDVNFDLLSGVDYKKGCFVGQEVASRMKRKGDARKRTLIAEFEGAPPEKGAAVTAGDSTLGHIMSGVDGAALALIRLDRWRSAEAAPSCGGRAVRMRLPDYMQTA